MGRVFKKYIVLIFMDLFSLWLLGYVLIDKYEIPYFLFLTSGKSAPYIFLKWLLRVLSKYPKSIAYKFGMVEPVPQRIKSRKEEKGQAGKWAQAVESFKLFSKLSYRQVFFSHLPIPSLCLRLPPFPKNRGTFLHAGFAALCSPLHTPHPGDGCLTL